MCTSVRLCLEASSLRHLAALQPSSPAVSAVCAPRWNTNSVLHQSDSEVKLLPHSVTNSTACDLSSDLHRLEGPHHIFLHTHSSFRLTLVCRPCPPFSHFTCTQLHLALMDLSLALSEAVINHLKALKNHISWQALFCALLRNYVNDFFFPFVWYLWVVWRREKKSFLIYLLSVNKMTKNQ